MISENDWSDLISSMTAQAINALGLAHGVAVGLAHNYVGTEHVLAGLMEEGGGAVEILEGLSVNLSRLRMDLSQAMEPNLRSEEISAELPFTPRAVLALKDALTEARRVGHRQIHTDHLLLGLLREAGGIAEMELSKHGVTLRKARRVARRVHPS